MKSYSLYLISFALLIAAIVLFRRKAVKNRGFTALFMLLAALQVMSSAFIYACLQFTHNDIGWSVLYTLTHELKGADIADYLLPGGLLICAVIVLLIVINRLLGKNAGTSYRYSVLACLLALLSFSTSPAVVEFGSMALQQSRNGSKEFAKYYVTQRDKIASPNYNLVYIYAESLEQTWFDEKHFPALLPELSADLRSASRFTQTEQLPGTGFTIAGIVASQCGLPLFFPFSMSYENIVNNFYPDALCLGDILKKSGYTNYFYQGADLRFSDKDVFLKTHGFDHINGLQQLQSRAPEGYRHQWGLYDDTLMDAVWDKFVELSGKKERFSLFALTVDTHPPEGFISKQCQHTTYEKEGKNNASLAAIACSQEVISRLIHRIKTSPWADNTIVVVSSDHLSMSNDAAVYLPENIGDRQNLFAIFKGRGETSNDYSAKRSSLDNGATVLEMLGGPGEIGLGRSSLSQKSMSALFDSFSEKLQEWQPNIIALWDIPKIDGGFELDPQRERLVFNATDYEFPIMLRVSNERVYPLVPHYSDLRGDYLVMEQGEHFVWVDRCYVLSWLGDRQSAFARSTQWCLAQGQKGGRVDIHPVGNAPITSAFQLFTAGLDKEKEHAIALSMRRDENMQYDAPMINFALIGKPGYVKSIKGLSRTERWGRWSNSLTASDVRIEYVKPLPSRFTLRIKAKAYGENSGKPITIRAGSEVRTIILGDALSTVETHFDSANDNVITITPPHPQMDKQEGSWTPYDTVGRMIGIGLAELQVIPQ